MKVCRILSNAFFACLKVIIWFLFFILLIWYITFIYLHVLNCLCLRGMIIFDLMYLVFKEFCTYIHWGFWPVIFFSCDILGLFWC
jgi:hypothetical protein